MSDNITTRLILVASVASSLGYFSGYMIWHRPNVPLAVHMQIPDEQAALWIEVCKPNGGVMWSKDRGYYCDITLDSNDGQ
jgi:hypothetical protein